MKKLFPLVILAISLSACTSLTSTQTTTSNPTATTPTELVALTAAPEINPVAPEGWNLYVNDVFGYQFYYPADATIKEEGVTSFPADELPTGKTADEYLTELQKMYSNKLCVSVSYGLGYVNFSAPANTGFRYTQCGRTGMGAGSMTDKTETIVIGETTLTTTGFEFIGTESPCDLLSCHNEMMALHFPDGIRIEYGAAPLNGAYADYVATTRPVLLQIVSTFAPTP
ncbi:MAG: hypothetical protein JXA21_17360 [Anaerolineae bacterium]|nr:hypothetical protein [Anaerolineae bacterium]